MENSARRLTVFGLFWPALLPAVLVIGLGGGILWVQHKAAELTESRARWVETEGVLEEIGVQTVGAGRRQYYSLVARFSFKASGRAFEGSWVAGRTQSRSFSEVIGLVLPYVPEAARMNGNDLGMLSPRKTWPLLLKSVPVKYDPLDPEGRSEATLVRSFPPTSSLPDRAIRAVAFLFIGLGVVILLVARHAGRPERPRIPAGPPVSSPVFQDVDRRRLIESIDRLEKEIDRVWEDGMSSEQRSFREGVRELVRTSRDGTLVPADNARYGYGRWASEVFDVGDVCGAASGVATCLEEMALIGAAPSRGPRVPARRAPG